MGRFAFNRLDIYNKEEGFSGATVPEAINSSAKSIGSVLNIPSVFKGETPFMTFSVTDENNITYVVGELWGKGGKLSFEGHVEESAKIFINSVIKTYEQDE